MTKARDDDGQLKLVHLRGRVGADPVDADAIARLVAGEGGAVTTAARPTAVFAAVILRDLDGTATVLTAIAREANEVYEVGCRGFRPRSAPLRQQRDAALGRAASECQRMADAWSASGLKAEGPLPGWLSVALGTENPTNLQVPN